MKKPLSRVASAVQASTTIRIDAMYKTMKAEGQDVVGFGAGEPDFNTPENIKTAGIQAIVDNMSKYTPAAGIDALRKAVCAQLDRDYSLTYTPAQVVISSGAKQSLFFALMTLCDPGDEVILPAPYWVSYEEMIRMAGATPVIVSADESSMFRMTAQQLDDACTSKTKALILNSPSNPTGMLYNREELEAIAAVCLRRGLYVISDEIYDKLVFGQPYVSFPTIGQDIKAQTILINGVSKSYAMTGWRIGWACADAEIAKVMSAYQSHASSAPSTVSQLAALEALDGPQESILEMQAAFEKRRDFFVKRVAAIDGVSCLKPDGAFYIFMNIKKLLGREIAGRRVDSADDFASLFLEKQGVAVVPCDSFGAPGYIRWSYATSMENIEKGLDRLEAFLGQ